MILYYFLDGVYGRLYFHVRAEIADSYQAAFQLPYAFLYIFGYEGYYVVGQLIFVLVAFLPQYGDPGLEIRKFYVRDHSLQKTRDETVSHGQFARGRSEVITICFFDSNRALNV